jgi:hypothetical protein
VRAVDVVLSVLLVLVILVALGLAIALLVAALRRRRLEQGLRERATSVDPMAAGPGLSDPRTIKPGDIVVIDAVQYVVRGTIALEEDGDTWREHLLDASGIGGEVRHWLSVEDGEGGLELALWDRVRGVDLSPDAEVTLEGVTYRRDERGDARFSSIGTTGAAPSGTMSYADYVQADGPGLLSLERYGAGGSWETSTGRTVSPEAIEILHS